MKLKIVITITGFVLLGVNSLFAQVPSFASEALMIGRSQPGGSARIMGMGGAQISLGGDISSAFSNPAGLGMYNKSEFTITPGYTVSGYSSSYLGNTNDLSKNTLIVPSFGMAFHKAREVTRGFLGGTFAISYNRTNDFNHTFTYTGKNNDNSIIDYFINNANGDTEAQFDSNINNPGYNYNTPTGLAYNNYLIGPETVLDPAGDPRSYFTDVYPYLPTQTEIVKNSGSQSQWNFSYGANFNDRIFVGLGIGFASFKYQTTTTYTETFLDPYPGIPNPNSPMTKMVLTEAFNMNGTGVNATLGAIFRPLDIVQFGVSIASPTSYQVSTEYSGRMSTAWNNFQYSPGQFLNNIDYATDLVTFDHKLSTPWRFSGGASVFFEKKGFLSVDAEFVDYSNSQFSSYSDRSSSDFDNKEVKSLYKSVLNLRVGGEYRLNQFRFRAGFNLMPDPYKETQNNTDNTFNSYSMGIGYRTSKFYVDLAGVIGQTNRSYRPYTIPSDLSPVVSQKYQSTTIAITLGFPFGQD